MSFQPRSYHDRSDKVVEVFKNFSDAANTQLHHLWFPDELKVEKDKQSLLTETTESERHGILTTLKLFTLYELKAGVEYWGDRYMRIMRGPEFTRMASVFAMTELAIHKPFYSKINEVLGLETDEFYSQYTDDPVLKSRMEFVDSILNHEDDLVSLGSFSLVEGGILYSAFSYLKHFSVMGKNKAPTICRGINFSVSDEYLHQQAGAASFRQRVAEMLEDGVVTEQHVAEVRRIISDAAREIEKHESHIADMIFSRGPQEGITCEALKVFVRSRLNNCLGDLGIEPIFQIEEGTNPIAEWFYKDINSFRFNDFFAGVGNQYVRNWTKESFDLSQDFSEFETP